MMKLINSVVMLMILCGSQFSNGEKLNCKFEIMPYIYASKYSCKVNSLLNPHDNVTIDGYSGEHMANRNDADVKGIWISGTNTKYVPTNLGSLFDLTTLDMDGTKLVEIKSKDFHGMQNLEFLNLYNNNLKFVPLDAFTTLTKLKTIYLKNNQIEELPNGIFENNLQLYQITLSKNNIKYLGAELFNGLKKLDFVDLRGNNCINEAYDGTTRIDQLKEDIKMNCTNPNEVSETTTATTTTLNPMEVKLIEMQEKISKLEKKLTTCNMNEDALTNEREALKKELKEAKDALTNEREALKKELREAKDALTKEREALKKELREAKELQQKNEDALMLKNFGLNQNLFDTKRELQMFKITCGVIRNNLKKAKEDLVNCSNANPRALMLK